MILRIVEGRTRKSSMRFKPRYTHWNTVVWIYIEFWTWTS